MAKKMIKENMRVEVYARNPGDFGIAKISGQSRSEAEEIAILEDIAAKIKRHVGKFDDDRGDVLVTWDDAAVCEHCGSVWTEVSPKYNGGCCQADMECEEVV